MNVAQSVEHQVVALRVVGSIPTIHPKKLKIAKKVAIIVKKLKIISALKKSNLKHQSFEIKSLCRGVAQLVAHSLWERGVARSSRVAPTSLRLSTPSGLAGYAWHGQSSFLSTILFILSYNLKSIDLCTFNVGK